MGGSISELPGLTNRLVASASAYGMEVSTDKSRAMANNTDNTSTNITMNGKLLEEVNSFRYLGTTLSKDGSCAAEIRIRVATATAAIARLQDMEQQHSFPTEFKLFSSLVVNTDKEFKVNIDVQHFKPEEISVKAKDNRLIINARHEERPDEHGFIMREFTRQYVLPNDVDPGEVKSSLNKDGILSLKAPKKVLEDIQERTILITHEKGDF